MRFRPNLVISGGVPYAEDGWSGLKIGKNHFMVSSISIQMGHLFPNESIFGLCYIYKMANG